MVDSEQLMGKWTVVMANRWINGGRDVVLNLVGITERSAHNVRGSMDTMYKTVPALPWLAGWELRSGQRDLEIDISSALGRWLLRTTNVAGAD